MIEVGFLADEVLWIGFVTNKSLQIVSKVCVESSAQAARWQVKYFPYITDAHLL